MVGRFGRKAVLAAAGYGMAVGVALTLATPLWCVLAGLVVATFCFFVAHAIAATWAGERVPAARSQASALYSLAYYAGSSLVGFLGAVVFDRLGLDRGDDDGDRRGRAGGDHRGARRAALGRGWSLARGFLSMTALPDVPASRAHDGEAGRSVCCSG